ncbi:NUDIX domain-containing protein [Candidatus Woesearchaeota archaeon]|nr:NUDIX domain-containing protein [Candidatus Woesearchaeota archaeon]
MEKGKRDKILIGTLLAVIDNEKVLLLQRTKEPYKGMWAMPGGKIEFGEHIEECAIREIMEETNVKCKVDKIRGIANEIVYENNKEDGQYILFVVQLHPETTEYKESEEGKLQWFGLEELEKINMIPSDRLMLKEFVLGKKEMKVHKIIVKKDGEKYDVEEFS